MQHKAGRLYLGVDGGASNITVVVLDEKGQSLYEETYRQGANHQSMGMTKTIENLEEAIQTATAELAMKPAVFEKSVFGLAGCNFESDHLLLDEALRKSSLSTVLGGGFEIMNDSRVALRAGTKDGVGVVLIAGTGSNCYGLNSDGQSAKSGGVDYILSDEGGGYDIGLRSLKAVARDLDSRGDETELTKAIFDELKVDSLESLYREVYKNYQSKSQIASLAKLSVDVATRGDLVARDILNHSVNELLSMVDAVLQKMDWRDAAVPVVAVGSVIGQKNYVRQRFEMELRRIAPKAKVVKPTISSGMGAALLAWESE